MTIADMSGVGRQHGGCSVDEVVIAVKKLIRINEFGIRWIIWNELSSGK
jgi:hypothetical protein